jgi:methionine-gamma-lyase
MQKCVTLHSINAINMPAKKPVNFATLCVERFQTGKPITPHTEPIYATSAYLFDSADHAMELLSNKDLGYVYSRWGNPTVEAVQDKLAAMETFGSNMNAWCQMFSSGMAAITATLMAHCKAGDKVLTQTQLYGTTDELMQSYLPQYGVQARMVNMQDLSAVEEVLQTDDCIRLIYLETPSNPLIELVDIAAICKLAAKYKVPVAVDNTFSTPYNQRPLLLGADFSVHSTTKFLNGHGTSLGGAVIGKNKKKMTGDIWRQVKLMGGNSNAFDAWLLAQGLKTLSIRMERHNANAMKIAGFLEGHPKVLKVHYAGLKSHPQYKLAKRQMTSGGAMLSFELKGGLAAGKKLMNRAKVCSLVTSLGTVDTLIQHPASMTHVNVPAERRLAAGITDGLVRMSVGIEDVADIISDLENGLK